MATAAQLVGFSVRIATRQGRHSPVVQALSDVRLRIDAGEVTALIGESGCGKSLVAAALCGLLPVGAHSEGRLLLDGRDLNGADELVWRSLRGAAVGLVPQSAATSFTPVRTVGSQLAEVCRRLGSDRSPAELLTAAYLDPDTARLYPHELSGGMAQRAAIAAALAGRPGLLLADEPTSALDPEHAALIWQLLGNAAADGAAVLAITHDLTSLMASGICRTIALMRDGTVLRQSGTTEFVDADDTYIRRFFHGVTL